jgi:fucokinase
MTPIWDYLILTASNDRQAAGYEGQLEVRRRAGLLAEVGTALVVADPQGKRVGSGGSTLYCLMRVVENEIQRAGQRADDWPALEDLLRRLRILILHAGGDSRRVPAYGPCGKIFAPVPGESCGGVISTLFDRLYPIFRDMPHGAAGAGQVIVAAGDALPLFDVSAVCFDRPGMTALGAYATPDAASKHGVFCVAKDGRTRLFLQKPSLAEQQRLGAIDSEGRSVLDIGVMSFNAETAVAILQAFDVRPEDRGPRFSAAMGELMLDQGMDLYREICCALGSEATVEHHGASCLAAGTHWSSEQLQRVFRALTGIPLAVAVLPECEFLHFGTTRQLITSGMELLKHAGQPCDDGECVRLNNRLTGEGRIAGGDSWVEGCRIAAELRLSGGNVVIGLDIDDPLGLPRGACVDVIAGQSRTGQPVWFVRMYDVDDTFKDPLERGATLGGVALGEWLRTVGATAEDVWPAEVAPAARSLWNARVFPSVTAPQAYYDWLWLLYPPKASDEERRAYLKSDRYSVAEIALLADMEAFYARRSQRCDTH